MRNIYFFVLILLFLLSPLSFSQAQDLSKIKLAQKETVLLDDHLRIRLPEGFKPGWDGFLWRPNGEDFNIYHKKTGFLLKKPVSIFIYAKHNQLQSYNAVVVIVDMDVEPIIIEVVCWIVISIFRIITEQK